MLRRSYLSICRPTCFMWKKLLDRFQWNFLLEVYTEVCLDNGDFDSHITVREILKIPLCIRKDMPSSRDRDRLAWLRLFVVFPSPSSNLLQFRLWPLPSAWFPTSYSKPFDGLQLETVPSYDGVNIHTLIHRVCSLDSTDNSWADFFICIIPLTGHYETTDPAILTET